MDTDQANKQPLPAKLRWRPYANGTSKKNSKLKKDITRSSNQGPDPKAVAHKMRSEQYYSTKPGKPSGIKLQWEEAETIESMSHGGHPHNQHHPRPASDRSRDSSPGASSDASSSSWSSSPNNTKSANPFTSAIQLAMGSLPSPPSSSLPTTRLDLVGGQSDFGLFKASVPDLAGGNDLFQNLPLNTMTSETAYQIALTALLQSQNAKSSLFHTPAIIGGNTSDTNVSLINNNNNNNNNNAAPIVPASASTLLGSPTIHSVLLSDPDRALSNQELLDVASIDELLASCGYADSSDSAVQMLASPANTDQSLNSSPMNDLLDFSNNGLISRGTSPAPVSFSPMALANAAFEALLAQPVAPQQTVVPSDPYDALLMELAAPFGYLSTNGDTSLNNPPTAWPSLFPAAFEGQTAGTTAVTTSTPQRSEIATQTDGPYEPPLSPTSARASSAPHGSPLPSDEELDPDWLNFLDEASEVFNEIDMPSPPPSGDEGGSESTSDSKSAQEDRSMWNWAGQLLKPTPVIPTGSRGFPSSGPTMTGIPSGSIGNGSLIRTLHSTSQQKSHKSPSSSGASSRKTVEDPKENKGAGFNAAVEPIKNEVKPTGSEIKERQKDKKEEDGGLSGLIGILKSLWIGNDGNNNK
ncbi:hypothetical protein BGZ79_010914 [Entomortierella chlamydospora]|nr:hypothetical protein BGZ79_010914 [Entomortierella chlamydospora]